MQRAIYLVQFMFLTSSFGLIFPMKHSIFSIIVMKYGVNMMLLILWSVKRSIVVHYEQCRSNDVLVYVQKHGHDFSTKPNQNQTVWIHYKIIERNSFNWIADLDRWRQWFAENEFLYNNYLWRNKTITNDTIFDHRIILEAYQRGAHVGSLETLPNDCFSVKKSRSMFLSLKYFLSRLDWKIEINFQRTATHSSAHLRSCI